MGGMTKPIVPLVGLLLLSAVVLPIAGVTASGADTLVASALPATPLPASSALPSPGVSWPSPGVSWPSPAASGSPAASLPASAPAPGQASASMVDLSFQPATLEVAAGTTVVWTNDDPVVHTVTARDGSFNSGVLKPGAEFSQVFETPGTYPYFCAIHPGQAGSIVVSG
jgi:plastocyanin